MDIVMVGPFGMAPKHTMRHRALPLACALAKRGHTVTILLPPWSNPEESGVQHEVCGVRVMNLLLPPNVPGLFHLWLTFALVRAALALKPAVVHCFKPKAYAGIVLWVLWHLRRLGLCQCRLILDTDDWEGAGGWNERGGYSWLMRWFFAVQERWCLTHADAVTVASRTLQSLAWSLGVHSGSVTYLPNGVNNGGDRSVSAPAVSQAPAQNPTVLLYTRFVEFSTERASELLRLIVEHRPDARVLVVGTGLSGEDVAIRKRLEGTVGASRIVWCGWIETDQLGAVFGSATLAIYPMDDTLLNRAKCPVKLTDLLQAGVVVVAENVGQSNEYIEHGVSGLLVPAGDHEALVAEIIRALDDATLRERLAEGARARMRYCFDWNRLVLDLERVYAA